MFVNNLAKLAGSLLMMAALAMPMKAGAAVIVQEGTLELAVVSIDQGAFGLGSEVPLAFQARFRVAYVGGGTPDPADLPAVLEDFDLTIGNAQWDETLAHSSLKVLVAGGVIQGIQLTLTDTLPHPDLSFFLPASPGRWEAHDWNGPYGSPSTVDKGKIGGTYQVTARVVPEPATLALFGLGLAGLGFSRRRTD